MGRIRLPKVGKALGEAEKRLERAAKSVGGKASKTLQNVALDAIDTPAGAAVARKLNRGYPKNDRERAKEEARIEQSLGKREFSGNDVKVLSDIASLGVSKVDLWHGSHVIAQGDHGALYDRWRKLGAQQRVSSHYPEVKTQQFGLRPGGAELLFGKTADGDTWFQMEKHAPGEAPNFNASDYLEHRLDYAFFKATGENIGPLGRSPHRADQDPLLFPY